MCVVTGLHNRYLLPTTITMKVLQVEGGGDDTGCDDDDDGDCCCLSQCQVMVAP